MCFVIIIVLKQFVLAATFVMAPAVLFDIDI